MNWSYVQYDNDWHILFTWEFKDGQQWNWKFWDLDFCMNWNVQASYIINIENWERNGKYVSYHPCNDVDKLHQIKSKWNFKNWEREWKWLEYRWNWELREEYTYENWTINWEYLYYDYWWDLSRISMYVDWKLNWKEYEYHNWEIIKVYERENWELIDSYPYSDNSLYKEIFK